mmetsp:Transcript_119958/g.267997  ORF Transcript_119958/g.267997 Transcript_119958/m.267997 type:complete len:83 (+) Transcript_119958:29-277(+)
MVLGSKLCEVGALRPRVRSAGTLHSSTYVAKAELPHLSLQARVSTANATAEAAPITNTMGIAQRLATMAAVPSPAAIGSKAA